MTKLALCLLLAIPMTSAAQPAAGPPPGPPPSSATAEKMWSRITVSSIKPTLAARNVFVLKGLHNNGVRGGWTLETRYQLDDAAKVVQITVAAHAPKGAMTTRSADPFDAKVAIAELAGPAYSGKPGKLDVVVVDRDGKELARTVYEVK